MLSELRCGSSCSWSESNPGASLTRVAQRKPPSKAVRIKVIPCRAIVRPSMVEGLLICYRTARLLFASRSFRVMNLFHGVHPPVGLGEQALDIETIVWTKGHSDAKGDEFTSTNVLSRFDCCLVQPFSFLFRRVGGETWSCNDEFVSSHTGNVVIPAADILEPGREFAQE